MLLKVILVRCEQLSRTLGGPHKPDPNLYVIDKDGLRALKEALL